MKRLMLIFAVVSTFLWSGKLLAQDSEMFIKKDVTGDFEQIVEEVKQEFKQVGFGVITEIDMDQKLEEKLDVDLKPYKILGVCNPGFAYKALQAEPNIGVFLPCKVIIRQMDGNNVEVVSSDPAMLMKMLNNEELNKLADEVSVKIKKAIENI
ncbi:MAG: DUF302 domain-containing protein [Bacteroidetes bacterium]|nr:DUF302 domain-containing protein [Bacteroidota bacterium]